MKSRLRLLVISAVAISLGELLSCTAGNYGATCENPGSIEICGNGIDDDCNGVVDDGCNCTPKEERPCFPDAAGNVMAPPVNMTDKSGCQPGTQTCTDAGNWDPQCVGGTPPTAEICGNDIDEDCDGQIDDADACQCVTGATRDCWVIDAAGTVSATPPPSHDNLYSRCKKGSQLCVNGAWTGSKCLDTMGMSVPGPQPETLDCKDNNCDGRIDEGLVTACKNAQNKCWGFYQCSGTTLTCATPAGLPDTNPASWHNTANPVDGSWDWNCSGNIEVNYCHAMGCAMGATNYFINTADPTQVCTAALTTTGMCPMYVAYSANVATLPVCGGAIKATRCVAGAGTCTPMALTPPDWILFCR